MGYSSPVSFLFQTIVLASIVESCVCVGGGDGGVCWGGGYGGFISPVRTIYWPVWMTHVEGGGGISYIS